MNVISRMAFILVFFGLFPISSFAQPIPPDRITNPPGLQMFMGAAYNSEDDEYFLTYASDGAPRGLRLTTDGVPLFPEIAIGPGGHAVTAIAYNPNRNEYLYVYRGSTIWGQYLTANGAAIGPPFVIGNGGEPAVAYSTVSDRYMVVFHKLSTTPSQVWAISLPGDSTAPTVLSGSAIATSAHTPSIAYGPISDTFLVAFTLEFSAPTRGNIHARLLNGNGVGGSGVFTVAGGTENQSIAEVAAGPSPTPGQDRFLVQFEDWLRFSTRSADVGAHYVDSNGAVSSRFYIYTTPGKDSGWDVPGPVVYNETIGKFVSTGFWAVSTFAREIDTATKALGPVTVVATNPSFPTAAASRPHPADPQVLVLTRTNNGGDGVHAHVFHLPSPPPSFSDTVMPDGFQNQSYSHPLPIVGGTPPLSYELIGGNPPPGIVGPNANGVMSGVPTAIGNFNYQIRVTDAEGRQATGSLAHAIRLAAPTPNAPGNGSVTNNKRPTFSWTAPPSAGSFTYNLVVENAETSAVVLSQNGIGNTSFTPTSDLPDGTLRWRVQAHDGTNLSPFSSNLTFELDSTPPATTALSGSVAPGFVPVPGATAISSSGQIAGFEKEKAVDGDPATFWSTPGRAVAVIEHITLDLGANKPVAGVEMRARSDLGVLFPKDFIIEVSTDNVNWVTVRTVLDYTAGPGTSHIFDFTSATIRYIRVQVTESASYGNKFYVQLAEIFPVQAAPALGTIILSWNAPSEDGSAGGAVVSQDIRYALGPVGSFNFGTATQVLNEPAPAIPGTPQSVTVDSLLNEATYTFGYRSVDNAGNFSNVFTAAFTTQGVAPEPINDLAAGSGGVDKVHIAWTAPHEDGATGAAVASYTVFYATFPINVGNVQNASIAPNAPSPPKNPNCTPFPACAREAMTIAGLNSNTRYYIGIVSSDDKGNISSLSNVASVETDDGIPPDPIADLSGAPGGNTLMLQSGVLATNFTGELPPYVKANTVDGDTSTFWSTPGRGSPGTELLNWDLTEVVTVAHVRLHSREDFGGLFPQNFEIQLSTDGASFATVLAVNNFVAADGTWYDFVVPPTNARFVRIAADRVQFTAFSHYVQLAEIEIYKQVFSPGGSVTLQWTAPHEDAGVPTSGAATSYEVHYSPDPILNESDFLGAMPVTVGVPAPPAPPGFPEFMSIEGLGVEAVNYFAVRALDAFGNKSDVVPGVKVSTQGTPPGKPTGLAIIASTGSSLTIEWFHSGDDGMSPGTANVTYDVRYSTSPIVTVADFEAAAQARGVPPSGAPGTRAEFDIASLENETFYYVAIRAIDDADNLSPIAGPVSGSTADELPPSAAFLAATLLSNFTPVAAGVQSSSGALASFPAANATDGNAFTFWSTPGRTSQVVEQITVDTVTPQNLGRVVLTARADLGALFPRTFSIQISLNGTDYTTVHQEVGFVAQAAASYAFDFTPQLARYLRVVVTESNVYGNKRYVQIAEMSVFASTGTEIGVQLVWTAPGDDGFKTGTTASAYDLRYSTTGPIDETNFTSATPIPGVPAPQVAGSQESFVASAPGEAQIYFALKTSDEVPNVSPVSNSPSLITPGIPPATPTDFTAAPLDETRIRLTWTAVSDDGNNPGLAADEYDLRYDLNPITNQAQFLAAPRVPTPAPKQQGLPEQIDVGGLPPDADIFFALRVEDEVNNVSGIVYDDAHTVDSVAPAPIANFAATTGGFDFQRRLAPAISASANLNATFNFAKTTDDKAATFWSTPARNSATSPEHVTLDLGSVMLVGQVTILSRADLGTLFPADFRLQVSTDNVSFTTVRTVTSFNAAPGTWYGFNFAPTMGRYVRVRVDRMNAYGSNFYAQIAEIHAFEAIPAGVRLTWTATGDNLASGTAQSYDIRYSDVMMTPATFAVIGAQVPNIPVPRPAGLAESLSVSPGPGTWFFWIKVTDEAGNSSFATNQPSVTVTP